jgi:hypothetical protein
MTKMMRHTHPIGINNGTNNWKRRYSPKTKAIAMLK